MGASSPVKYYWSMVYIHVMDLVLLGLSKTTRDNAFKL